jgi:hypothetical protein
MPLHGVCCCPMTMKSVIDRLLRPICEGTERVQLALNQVREVSIPIGKIQNSHHHPRLNTVVVCMLVP